jgi:heptose-I-phosphate ethanolaminephosphotransferase
LIVLNLYLLSPVLLAELGLRHPGALAIDKLALFAVPASVLSLALFQLAIADLFVAHLLLVPFYFLVGVDLFVLFQYDVRLTSSMASIILENVGDSGSYVRQHACSILFSALPLLLLAVAVAELRGARFARRRRRVAATAVALASLYAAVGWRQVRAADDLETGLVDVASHDRSAPFGVLPQLYVAYTVYRGVLEHRAASETFRFDAKRDPALVVNAEERETYVLVIGESSRRDHWGLYGYPRATTPRLGARTDLVVFKDVLTQAALTKISVPLLLTRGTIDDRARALHERSLLSAFQEAGFESFWLSTQQRDHWSAEVNLYSAEAQHQRFFERRHDGVLVEELRRVLTTGESSPKRLIVMHTQGSHASYDDRYPATAASFSARPADTEKQRLVDTYDDSILYTDAVLDAAITLLAERHEHSALLYVADHGENLRDDERGLLGHFYGNEYDLPIPMVLWRSPELVGAAKGTRASAAFNADRPINTRAIFYTMLDLAEIVIDDPALATHSVLRETWNGPPRRFLRRDRIIDEAADPEIANGPPRAWTRGRESSVGAGARASAP